MKRYTIDQTAFSQREPLHEEKVEFLEEAEVLAREAKRKRLKLIGVGLTLLLGSLMLLAVLVEPSAPAPTPIAPDEPIVEVAPTAVPDTSLYRQIQAAKQYTETLTVNEVDFALPVVDTAIAID